MPSAIDDGWGELPPCSRRMQRRIDRERRRTRRQLEEHRAAVARAVQAEAEARWPLPPWSSHFASLVAAAILAAAAGAITGEVYCRIIPALLLGVTSLVLVAVACARRWEAQERTRRWGVSLARCQAAVEKAERELADVRERLAERQRRFRRMLADPIRARGP